MLRHVLGTLASALAAGFVALAVPVAVGTGVPGERRLLRAVVLDGDTAGATLARGVDAATRDVPLALATAALVAGLVVARRRTAALSVLVAVGGVLALNPVLKQLVDRPRPGLVALEDASALGFPSGHASGTAALAVAVVLAVGAGRRRGVVVAALLLVLVTAAAQLVLARHHPSDVLAGWLWASAWTAAVWSQRGQRLLARLPGGPATRR